MASPSADENLELLLPQIAWHDNRAAIQSVDASPTSPFVATAGNDNEVHLWKITTRTGAISFVQALTGHTKPVNVVRFCPNGVTLASAGIDMQIMLWRERSSRPQPVFGESSSSAPAGEGGTQWAAACCLRGHISDVHALAWSPRADSLFSGDVSGMTIVWDVKSAKPQQIVREHEHYVQGVAWDPCDEHLVSVSCDRSVRLYSTAAAKPPAVATLVPAKRNADEQREFACHTVVAKRTQSFVHAPPKAAAAPDLNASAAPSTASPGKDGEAATADDAAVATPSASASDGASGAAPTGGSSLGIARSFKAAIKKEVPLFLDDSVASFYRRPDWSPDGSFLLLPCGQYYADNSPPPNGIPKPTTFVFARHNLAQPCAHLPSPDKPVVALRCSPVLYEHRADADAPATWMGGLPYRVLWAAVTLDSLIVYDSSQQAPLLVASNAHFAPLTDVAWLPGGNALIASSDDGYCTLLRFRPGALGTPLPHDKLPASMRKHEAPAAPQPTASNGPTVLQVRKKPKPATDAPLAAASSSSVTVTPMSMPSAFDAPTTSSAFDAPSGVAAAPAAPAGAGDGAAAVKVKKRIVPVPMPLS